MELLAQFQERPTDSLPAFALVAAAGLLMGVAPSALPLVSVVVGSVAGRETPESKPASRQGLLFANGFVLGIATIDAAMGGLFGFIGDAIIRALVGSLAITNLVLAALLLIFNIDGMQCDGCAERVRTLLSKEAGVHQARVSFAEESAEVRYNPHSTGDERLREVIEKGGFDVVEQIA